MIDNILFKVLAGEEVSEEEKTRWQAYAEKYQAVIEKYLAKRDKLGLVKLHKFHFTPGDNFENASVDEVVNELIKVDAAPKTELKFDDFTLITLDD